MATTYALVYLVCALGRCDLFVADTGMSREDCKAVLMMRGTTRKFSCMAELVS